MNQSYVPMLSKSRFLAGLHCPLNLWYQCYNRDLASEVSPAQQAIFDMGHEVGRLATKLYPGGVLIEEDKPRRRDQVPRHKDRSGPVPPPARTEAAGGNSLRCRRNRRIYGPFGEPGQLERIAFAKQEGPLQALAQVVCQSPGNHRDA